MTDNRRLFGGSAASAVGSGRDARTTPDSLLVVFGMTVRYALPGFSSERWL